MSIWDFCLHLPLAVGGGVGGTGDIDGLWSGFYTGIQIQGLLILQQELYPLDHLP